jgi:DsbC/DsbD-like thiol-disulfide interchange protein/cytochrome c biogenesis protein CcdA
MMRNKAIKSDFIQQGWIRANIGLAAIVLLLIAIAMVSPRAIAQMPGAKPNVSAVLAAETAAPALGKKVTLAFVMTPKKGWHGYWVNGGDAGVGMRLEWQLPPGVRAGELRYPVPKPLIIFGLMNYVYEAPYTLLVDLDIAPNIAPGTRLPIKVRGDWLACTDRVCVPEGADLSVDLAVGLGGADKAKQAQFDAYRAALPIPIDQQASYQITGNSVEIAIPFPAAADVSAPYFFPLIEGVFDYPVPQSARRVGDRIVIKAAITASAIGQISGVLRYGDGRGLIVNAAPGDVPAGGKVIPMDASNVAKKGGDTGFSFAAILGMALLGGLILNLMPCVFPILGLKALSLSKMGGDEGAARRDALSYTAGVVLSCIMLGGVLLALRAGGQQVGWAFQLQEPRIVLLLFLLMAAITLNLLGVFELWAINAGGALAQKSGLAGSFWTGVLAAVVATPCTGPFMAAALGAALILPALPALTLFAGLGLGLATPYLAVAYIPRLRRMLPKPGPWLVTFQRWMALPMAITAAALLWLLWRLSGSAGMMVGAFGAFILCGALIFLGKGQRQPPGYKPSLFTGRPILSSLVLVAFALASANILPREPLASMPGASGGMLSAAPYTDARLEQLRRSGTPVFVYFTADWCLTCKVNEAAAIERDSTAAAFTKAGVRTLVGDFTRSDPALARVLERHGRSGVPLYLYYAKGKDAKILPQILTADMLATLVE